MCIDWSRSDISDFKQRLLMAHIYSIYSTVHLIRTLCIICLYLCCLRLNSFSRGFKKSDNLSWNIFCEKFWDIYYLGNSSVVVAENLVVSLNIARGQR